MINIKNIKRFCKEDISKIENYDKAINDSTQMWECHHRNEIKVLPSGMTVIHSRQELKENNRYYNCPANELIFLTKEEHNRLHCKYNPIHKGIPHSEETRRKISEARKSIFSEAFKEHYGMTSSDNIKLYKKEYYYYKKLGHFSWEVKYGCD